MTDDVARGVCFHCGLPLAATACETLQGGEKRSFCCPGCAAAAELIHSLGLQAYYRFRTAAPDRVASEGSRYGQFDDPALQGGFVRQEGQGSVAYLDVRGIHCAACAWLVDRALQSVPGVSSSSVNSATGRARVTFDPKRTTLSSLLSRIAEVGYRPSPISQDAVGVDPDREMKNQLKRLAVAGFGMMQVMMFAVALYTGEFQGMDAVMRSYMRYVSLLVATPVMVYAGWPFYAGAVNALRSRGITMDVPVSLGLLLAYSASLIDTVTHRGEVYFDSVTMFIFFLTLARFMELVARRRCVNVTESLSRLLPALAHRLRADGSLEDVPVTLVKPGDSILVKNGEVVPADAEISKGSSSLDESMLTGESSPLERGAGDTVLAGSLNSGGPLECRVKSVGQATVLSSIVALLLRAQTERPKAVREADRMARRFLTRVLLGAAVVFVAWHFIDAARAFNATLAVLVVACPCALSLGPLIALASATSALAREGLLVSHPDAIEGLAGATTVVFDKTGTLTAGRVRITSIEPASNHDASRCLEIASALEAGTDHPLARAFSGRGRLTASDVSVRPGAGVEGCVDGKRYRVGSRAFALDGDSKGALDVVGDSAIVLAEEGRRIATFELADSLRPEASRVIASLRDKGLTCEILSGDALERVAEVARSCGITRFTARCTPKEKLERVRSLIAAGESVTVVGDGINDAPVLAGASVSIAMSQGSALAQASADLVLVQDSLKALPIAFAHARRCKWIMRQNMVWAATYNLVAIPLAALGWVPPWIAALGMSASSILVVLNSLRLNRGARASARDKAQPAPQLHRMAA